MQVTSEDKVLMKLTMYREDAAAGLAGMRAVGHVIMNRALKNGISVYEVCTKPWQFSSISMPGQSKEDTTIAPVLSDVEITRLKNKVNNAIMFDHVLSAWPQPKDSGWALWKLLDALVEGITNQTDTDVTNGATFYYASSMKTKPNWDFTKLKYTATIGGHEFYSEV